MTATGTLINLDRGMLCEIVPALQDVVSAQPRRRWMFHMLRTSQECRG